MTTTAMNTILASENLITVKSGKLAWAGDFPEDKAELSALMTVLSDDYIARGGEVTTGSYRLPQWSVNRGQTAEDY